MDCELGTFPGLSLHLLPNCAQTMHSFMAFSSYNVRDWREWAKSIENIFY